VKAIAAGWDSLALKTDGRVLAWGCLHPKNCRVPVAAQSGVKAIADGSYSLALTKGGRLVAWGCPGGEEQCRVPASARPGVRAVAVGYFHGIALKLGP